MKTALIIVHYNDYSSTSCILKNVKDYSSIDHILVVDNNSSDNSYQKLLMFNNKKIEIVKTEANRGYSSAINFGCKYLIKKYKKLNLIISNSDILINKDSDILELCELLNSDKSFGVIAPVVLEGKTLNRGWRIPSPVLEASLNIPYFHRFIRKHFVHYKEEHYNGRYSEVEALSGCFFIIKSDTLEKINYLDENVFLYYEENILAKRLKKIKKKLIIDNEILVVHNHSVSIDKNLKKIKKYRILKKSQYYFQTTYNNASFFSKILLKVSAALSVFLYTIYYWLVDLI